jgi:predicted polyphosphate/ATP-dependent NAD kinase
MNCIGFVVNPDAGMGGAVGLKGTDGCIEKARDLGALPVSPDRANRFLSALCRTDLCILTASGLMGEEELKMAGYPSIEVVYTPDSPVTGSGDTKKACEAMIAHRAEIILFCGGDGTARDVFSVSGRQTPILGIPAGVKIYSGVFATTPEAAAKLLDQWETSGLTDVEVMDVDEEQYRAGVLSTRLYGIAQTPSLPGLCQSSKQASYGDEFRIQNDIARFIVAIMRSDTLYLLGAGSTTGAIADYLRIPATLLGVDAIYQGRLIASDLNEAGILALLDQYDQVKIIISPIGAQGFVLGRGNQQISNRVLEKTGLDSLIVVATPTKLKNTPVLYVDTGNKYLNNRFEDTIQVICGYMLAQRVRLNHGP